MLCFDEATHTYSVLGKDLRSVSSVVASQFRKFNSHVVSRAIARSNNKESPYYGMTQDDILKKWGEAGRESRDLGTALHLDIENYYRHGTKPVSEDAAEWKQFMEFNSAHSDWACLATEFIVHNDKVAGTIDAVFDTPEGVVLVDWKRTKAIDYSGYGMGRDVMRHVADCNYSKYSLQLSLYKQLCSFSVSACYIVQMHPTLETYNKIRAQDFSMEAKILIA